MNRIAVSISIGLMIATVEAFAQTSPIYRCGNAYSQSPCPKGSVVDADDLRTPEQRAQAERVAAEAKQSAARMQQERLAEEARLRPANAGRLSTAPQQSSAASEVRHVKRPRKSASASRRRNVALDGATSTRRPDATR